MIGASALVCTRNRPESLVRTVRSILITPGDGFELIVMDQSESDDSERALEPFQQDARFRYVRTRARGKGTSLNEGLRLARAAIVVCTDDDCEVPAGWALAMANVIDAHPKAAIVFCNVDPPPYDRTAGYVPAYQRQTDRVLRTVADARHGIGIGASMALRRDVILGFGGFDETFGPGARFRSGDDWDLSLRALLQGWEVYDTASVSVLHHGFRSHAEGRDHAYRDWVAIGALCAKPVRAGRLAALIPAAWWFGLEALWPPVNDLFHLRRPRGLARIVGFTRGFADGLRTAVDRKTLVFKAAG